MAYCNKCGYGIGSQGHYDCCITKKSTRTRNGMRINDWEAEDEKEETEAKLQEYVDKFGEL